MRERPHGSSGVRQPGFRQGRPVQSINSVQNILRGAFLHGDSFGDERSEQTVAALVPGMPSGMCTDGTGDLAAPVLNLSEAIPDFEQTPKAV